MKLRVFTLLVLSMITINANAAGKVNAPPIAGSKIQKIGSGDFCFAVFEGMMRRLPPNDAIGQQQAADMLEDCRNSKKVPLDQSAQIAPSGSEPGSS